MLELEVKDFDLKQVLECGQVFRFEKISDTEYIILNKSNIAHCIQKASKLFITIYYSRKLLLSSMQMN